MGGEVPIAFLLFQEDARRAEGIETAHAEVSVGNRFGAGAWLWRIVGYRGVGVCAVDVEVVGLTHFFLVSGS